MPAQRLVSAGPTKRPRSWRAWSFVLLLLILLWARAACATLGHSETEIGQDEKALKLEKSESGSGHGYKFVRLSSADFSVKEYVNPRTGLIFGVSWTGNRPPNLLFLLGFDPATLNGPGVHRSLRFDNIETSTLILQFGGAGGSYGGRAVRKDLLPPGVPASEVATP